MRTRLASAQLARLLGPLALGPVRSELVTCGSGAAGMYDGPSLADDPERRLTLRQADQARADFAAILDELECLKWQIAQVPNRAWLSRMLLLGFGSLWAMFGALALWLAA